VSGEVEGTRDPCPHCGATHPPSKLKCPSTDLALPLEGRILDGRFRLVRELGRGGMASVWLALNSAVDRLVAIKLIRPEVAKRPETVARFRSEARAAGRIDHPNICQILDFGSSPIGPYMVMEYLRGCSLAELLRSEQRPPIGTVVAIVRQALSGLAAAHREGIVHRDLKPENVFIHVPENGPSAVKLMDFGVSKLTDGTGEIETEHGALLGTPEYMSPEQVGGAAMVDARCDLWAVGAILYRGLTGRLPFKGATIAATLLELTNHEPAPIELSNPEVPAGLQRLVMGCLAKAREDRPADADTLAEALAPWAEPTDLAGLVTIRGDDALGSEDEARDEPTRHDGERSDDRAADGDDDGDDGDNGDNGDDDESAPPIVTDSERRRAAAAERKTTVRQAQVAVPPSPRWAAVGLGLMAVAALAWFLWPRDQRPEGTVRTPAAATAKPPIAGASTGSDIARGTSNGASSGASSPAPDLPAPPDPDIVIDDDTGTSGASAAASAGTDSTGPADDAGTSAAGSSGGHIAATGGKTSGAPPSPVPSPTSAPHTSTPPVLPVEPPVRDPAGTFRVGNFLVLNRAGPTSTHSEARAYCKGLASASHVGVSKWILPNPTVARTLAGKKLKKGRYWTSARYQGRARVVALPKGEIESELVDKKRIKAVCVARVPRP